MLLEKNTKRWKKIFIAGAIMIPMTFMTLCSAEEKKEQSKTELLLEKVGQITVRAQNCYSLEFKPSNLIDKNFTTCWHSAPPAGTLGWVSISYPKPFKASEYKIWMRPNEPTQAPMDFVLEGSFLESFSPNNSDWQIIGAQKRQEWKKTNMQAYKIANPKGFRHYRLRILKTASTEYVSIAEWKLEE